MKKVDYENLFIYMSLIFAICIFIFLLYSCVFSSGPHILENFAEKSKKTIKSEIVPLLEHFKDSTTTQEQKEELENIIEELNNSGLIVNITELVSIIDRLKNLVKSETIKPDAVQPEAIKPDAVQSNAVQSDTVQSDTVQPDAIKPDTIKPDTVQLDAIKPDAIKPDASLPPPI